MLKILYYTFISYFYLVSFTSIYAQAYNSIVGAVLEKDIAPASNSLSGSGFSKPQSSDFWLTNPSQLLTAPTFEIFSSYLYAGFNNNYASFFVLQRFWNIPFALTTTLLIPQKIDYLADTGEVLGAANYIESITSLSTAYGFSIRKQKINLGLNLKYYYSQLFIYSSHSFASDFNITLPFKIPKWAILDRNDDNENFHISISILNAGSPIRYIQQSYNLPTSVQAGVHWNMLDLKHHQIDLFYAMKTYVTENRPYSWLVYNGGIQYTLYNILSLRAGSKYDRDQFKSNVGIGLVYVLQDNLLFKLDYDFNLGTYQKLDYEHNISFKFSFVKLNYSKKISETAKSIEHTARNIENLIVDLIQDSINEFKNKNGNYPTDLSELLSILKEKYGLDNLPQPKEGTLHYLPGTGQVVIIKKNDEDFKDIIVFKDGSRIQGTIEKDLGENLFIVHKYGSMTIPKANVDKIDIIKSTNIDETLLKDVQNYVFQFQQMKGRYPLSLRDLEQYVYLFGINKLPEPQQGYFLYDNKSGIVLLKKGQPPAARSNNNSSKAQGSAINQQNIDKNKLAEEEKEKEAKEKNKRKLSVEEDFLLNY